MVGCPDIWEKPVKKLSATEAMNIYEGALRALPEISSLHLGFDDDKPMIIVTARRKGDDVDNKIYQTAPDAPIKIIHMATKKPIDAAAAAQKYGPAIRKIKSVTSVNVGKRGKKPVLIVRAFPLTDGLRAHVYAAAPDAQIEFRESPHHKNSVNSVVGFVAKKLRIALLVLGGLAIVLGTLSPLYSAVGDLKYALIASSADGTVVASGRPTAEINNREEISQEVTITFTVANTNYEFTENASLFKILSHFGNLNAEPYHKHDRVTVAYQSKDPEATARIFDRGRFWATILIYLFTLGLIALIGVQSWRKWEEW